MLTDTLKFPDLLRKLPPKGLDEVDISYDVESLFTSIPISDTIDFIIDEIYEKNLLPHLCKQLIFRRLLERLCSGCLFSANNKLIRQKDGCPIGGIFSMIMAGICMTKCIRTVVIPRNPPFFGLYVDDGYCRQKKDDQNGFFDALNSFHHKVKFTAENEPDRFLDSEFIKDSQNGTFSLRQFHKPNKFPVHWSSQTPRRYKKNAIICELHRAFLISDDFEFEVDKIRNKYCQAGYPRGFVENTIKNFKFSRIERIIPENFFDEKSETPILRIRIPFCPKNENLSRTFLRKLRSFIGDSYEVFIIWNTSKIRSLFPLKDKNLHPNCVIYEGTCSCGQKYVDETNKCFHLRKKEHEDIKKKSECAKHLKANRTHSFTWRIIANAPNDQAKRKTLEALYIAKFEPGLNDQVKSQKLRLFVHGIT